MSCSRYCKDSSTHLQVSALRWQKRKRNSKYNYDWNTKSSVSSSIVKSGSGANQWRRNYLCDQRFSRNQMASQHKICQFPYYEHGFSPMTTAKFSRRHINNNPLYAFSIPLIHSIEPRPSYKDDLIIKGLLVEGCLGSGSYSKVTKAIDTRSNFAEVAVKIVDKCHATKEYLEKFLPREISVWMSLSHPNLIKLYDYFEANNRVYMVLEYASGGDALNYIQQNGPLSEAVAKEWFSQISSALSYMHGLNIAHRDLKLENLLLVEGEKKIKLGDFGFVKDICSNELSNTFCGSKAYAAPEILSGQSYNPKKGDVWSIGVVLYIILTGKMPFNETMGTKNILEEQAALNLVELSPSTKRVIMRAFTWNVELRPDIDTLREDKWVHPGIF